MKRMSLGVCAALAAVTSVGAAAEPTDSILYRFKSAVDGNYPSSLIRDSSGSLYGTTYGGASGNGSVFALQPPSAGTGVWNKTVLHSFAGGSDGSDPTGLIQDSSGALYVTAAGGAAGNGAVFKLTPPAPGKTAWSKTALYGFRGGTDGASPSGALIADKTGSLYGTTNAGGGTGCFGSGCGTVFKLTPASGKAAWTEAVLYRFTGGLHDGANPSAGVIADPGGALYGTASAGGETGCFGSGCGTVFKLAPTGSGATAWALTLLYTFKGGTDGGSPSTGLFRDSSDNLYGTTYNGGSGACASDCGTVFKLAPPISGKGGWTKTILYLGQFSGLGRESSGAFYGTISGGFGQGYGTVVKLSPPASGATGWAETVLYSFKSGTDGELPDSGVIRDSTGALYGTTEGGGGLVNGGTVFRLAP